jgi:molecular chaperone GrpE
MVDKHSNQSADPEVDITADHEIVQKDDDLSSQEEFESAEAPIDEASQDPVVLNERLDAARMEVAALKDRSLRSQADAENVRRRAARDVEHAHKFALEKFTTDLLPVLDSLEKAMEMAEAGDSNSAIGEGVELSLKLFFGVLEKTGITQIDPVGEPFDPELHEAIAMVENPDSEPNSVLEVMQRGYLLNGRLVRAAKVIVSKAPAG